MKKIFQLFLLLFSSAVLLAQAPEKINYQAVARDLSGNPLINQTLSVTFEIRQGSSSGTSVYTETHTGINTNAFGLFTAEIGGGTPSTGTFPGINWGNGLHYLYVEVNGNPMGSSQLLSVPYALHAKTASSGSTSFWSQSGNTIYNNNIFGAGNVSIGTPLSYGKLTVASPAADSLIASFIGSNPSVSAITISNTNPTGAAGVTFLSGTNITSYVAYSPSIKTLSLVNDVTDGHIYINSDSTIVNQTKIIANQTDIIANQAQNAIYNNTDTIFNYSPAGAVIHVNQGLFITDSLYVLGNNFLNPNWILANNGLGQARWTDPNTLGLGGSLWQSNTPNIYFNTGNVGIGTTSPSAKLHLEGSLRLNNLGGLAPANGLVLTSMDAQGNAEWAPPSGAANVWNLTGNAGTNAATNFIGTNDNVALNFRVFNQKAGKIDNGLYVAFYGYQAGNANTTGGNNNAFGTQAMFSNTTGGSNNAFGWAALYSNTGGQANTALGEGALYSTVSSNYNTSVGYEALYFSTGTNNTAIGANSAVTNTTGSNNTFIGADADATAGNGNLTNATAIGYNAKVGQNNSLILGNNANVGIGTSTPESKLHIKLPNSALTNALQLGHGNQPNLEWLFKVDALSRFSIANENNGTELTALSIEAITANVGIGKLGPTVKLDVNGDVAFNQYTFTSPGTTYNDFNTNNMSYVRMDITNNTILNGILAPAGTDGKILIMHFHITNGTLMINSESAVALAQNRLKNLTQGNLTLSTVGLDMILTYVYSAADQRWMLVSKN